MFELSLPNQYCIVFGHCLGDVISWSLLLTATVVHCNSKCNCWFKYLCNWYFNTYLGTEKLVEKQAG